MYYAILAMNVLSFCLFGLDKSRAAHHRWRIPEAVLLLSCALFGALGGLLGMKAFHHKTKKPKFTVTVPILLLSEAAVLYFFLRT